MQFAFRRMQMLFRFCTMSSHIVVVRRASVIHLMDRFYHMVMDRIQVVPVMHSLGNRDPGGK